MAIENFVSSVWSENLYRALDKKYIAAAHCNRLYEGEIRERGNTVNICGIGDITVSDYKKNTDMSSPEALNDNQRSLVIDQAKYFNFQIDDIDRAQSSPHLMELAMKNAANALANEADKYIFGLYDQAGQSLMDMGVSSDHILNYLIDAQTMLLAQNVHNPDDVVIEVSPAIAALIQKAKMKFESDNTDVWENGCIGRFMGSKIYVSNHGVVKDNCHKCLVRTKRAIAFAEQLSEIDAYRPELRFADAVKGLHLYGAKVVYPQEMVLMDFFIAG